MASWDSPAKALGPGHLSGQVGTWGPPPSPLSPQGAAEPNLWTLPLVNCPVLPPHQASLEGPCWGSQGRIGDMDPALGRQKELIQDVEDVSRKMTMTYPAWLSLT